MSKLIAAIASFNVSECVKDWDGNIMPSFLISTDLDTWKFLEVRTVEDLEKWLNFKQGFSDYHKEVHGSRPRWDFSGYTLSTWEQTYKLLEEDMERVLKDEAEAELIAVEDFKKMIMNIRRSGAKDFGTALRWLFQGDDINTRHPHSVETFLWDHGILHSEYGKSIFKRVCPSQR